MEAHARNRAMFAASQNLILHPPDVATEVLHAAPVHRTSGEMPVPVVRRLDRGPTSPLFTHDRKRPRAATDPEHTPHLGLIQPVEFERVGASGVS